jgi:nucleoside 2-deoxyribosyltransferase
MQIAALLQKPKQKLIYLASPYSAFTEGREKAEQLVSQKAAELMLQGFNVFCPIAHSHAIEEYMSERQTGDFWLEQDFAVLKHCDELLVYKMPGWEDSYGVWKEIHFAGEHGIPVKYIDYAYN